MKDFVWRTTLVGRAIDLTGDHQYDLAVAEISSPIGCAPRSIYLQRVNDLRQKRMDELWEAILRYVDAGKIPDLAWLLEFNVLRREHEDARA